MTFNIAGEVPEFGWFDTEWPISYLCQENKRFIYDRCWWGNNLWCQRQYMERVSFPLKVDRPVYYVCTIIWLVLHLALFFTTVCSHFRTDLYFWVDYQGIPW